MKARVIAKREAGLLTWINTNHPKYYAICNDVPTNYQLVQEGQLEDGDYFLDDSYEEGDEIGNDGFIMPKGKKIWVRALGAVGDMVADYVSVCRPKKLDIPV